jgi:hypothetical protein
MKMSNCRRLVFGLAHGILLSAALLLAAVSPAAAGPLRSDMTLAVGDQVPLFAVPTSQGTLADYQHDYYGQHHLVLTFFPAAFTPV